MATTEMIMEDLRKELADAKADVQMANESRERLIAEVKRLTVWNHVEIARLTKLSVSYKHKMDKDQADLESANEERRLSLLARDKLTAEVDRLKGELSTAITLKDGAHRGWLKGNEFMDKYQEGIVDLRLNLDEAEAEVNRLKEEASRTDRINTDRRN